MLLYNLLMKTITAKNIRNLRRYSQDHPFTKTINLISKEIPSLFSKKTETEYPEHIDVVIIGGGFIGSSVAYSLKTRASHGLSVLVIEKDLTYKNVRQSNVALGTLTHHYSLPENILMSKHTREFLRNAKETLNCDVDMQFRPTGQLVLASEKYAEKLERNVMIQKENGIRNNLLLPEDLKLNYPWLNTDDVALGCLGVEAEGTFNAWLFLRGLVSKSQELGAIYIESEVTGFELQKQRDVLMEGVPPGTFERINKVKYRTPDGSERSVKFAACVLAAGHDSCEIGKLAKIGTGDLLLQVPLPVEKREVNIYSFEDKQIRTGLSTPCLMDTSGLWVKKNGLNNDYFCGHIPSLQPHNMTDDEFYTDMIQPSLVNRIPACQKVTVRKIATEIQDCNTFDGTGILGPHAYHNNLYLAAGFGKEGCLHAPGIGQGITELIIDSYYKSIDLTRFGYDRIVTLQPFIESNMY